MKEELPLKGTFHLVLRGSDGRIKARRKVHNVITDVGRAYVIDMLNLASRPTIATFIGIGTGATAAAAADTALQTEVGTRQNGSPGTQPTAYTDRIIVTFAAANGTGNITEAGRFDAVTTGLLVARTVFTAINKTASDSLQITYDLTV